MNTYNYKSVGFEISELEKEYIAKKFDSFFHKYEILNNQMDIELGKSTNHHKNGEIYFAEVRFQIKKQRIFARTDESSVYEAVDHLQKEVYSQIEVAKGRRFTLFKKGAIRIKELLKKGVASVKGK